MTSRAMQMQNKGAFLRPRVRGQPSETLRAEGTRPAGQGVPARGPRELHRRLLLPPLPTGPPACATRAGLGAGTTPATEVNEAPMRKAKDASEGETQEQRPRTLCFVGAKGKNVCDIRNMHHRCKCVISMNVVVGRRIRQRWEWKQDFPM